MEAELQELTTKEKLASEQLKSKEDDFQRMGEAMGQKAEQNAMLKVEMMQIKGELMMAQ